MNLLQKTDDNGDQGNGWSMEELIYSAVRLAAAVQHGLL